MQEEKIQSTIYYGVYFLLRRASTVQMRIAILPKRINGFHIFNLPFSSCTQWTDRYIVTEYKDTQLM